MSYKLGRWGEKAFACLRQARANTFNNMAPLINTLKMLNFLLNDCNQLSLPLVLPRTMKIFKLRQRLGSRFRQSEWVKEIFSTRGEYTCGRKTNFLTYKQNWLLSLNLQTNHSYFINNLPSHCPHSKGLEPYLPVISGLFQSSRR